MSSPVLPLHQQAAPKPLTSPQTPQTYSESSVNASTNDPLRTTLLIPPQVDVISISEPSLSIVIFGKKFSWTYGF
ncbi:hypothetical protein GQ44DRAFT_237676 [Phaeosphaeriaceae sp. PMI808]|nr:hypothetical protein GQ44DRAFT_237676 [Phaeosphaeriaceae sp. PMI808]